MPADVVKKSGISCDTQKTGHVFDMDSALATSVLLWFLIPDEEV